MSGNTFCPNSPDSQPSRQPLVFLPGWGFDGRVLQLAPEPPAGYVPASRALDPTTLVGDLLAFLNQQGIERIRLTGWSMGAHLALDFARAHPERVASLTLLAMRRHWPADEIAAIRHDLTSDSAAFLTSFYRKCFAGDKPAYRRFTTLLEEEYLGALDRELLDRGLDFLAATRPEAPGAGIPIRLVQGRRDLIAPARDIAELPGATVEFFDHAGHAVFLAPDFSWPASPEATRKRAIRQRFSRAATTYDAHADVQKEVAQQLVDRLPSGQVDSILEIGCGSGFYTEQLAARFPRARILALDFSAGMVATARAKLANNPRVRFLCEDGEQYLATTRERFDLITSNATLQWFDDPVAAVARMAALLIDHGSLLCSLFGPLTLSELGQGLAAVCGQEVSLPPHRFPTLADQQEGLADLLSELDCTETVVQRQYQTLRELLLHIKLTGTSGGVEADRPLLTRARFRALDRWFAEQYGGYPATYQTFVIQGKKGG